MMTQFAAMFQRPGLEGVMRILGYYNTRQEAEMALERFIIPGWTTEVRQALRKQATYCEYTFHFRKTGEMIYSDVNYYGRDPEVPGVNFANAQGSPEIVMVMSLSASSFKMACELAQAKVRALRDQGIFFSSDSVAH